jgi:hypothetical protein
MDVYKGLHDPRVRGGAGSETHRAQPARQMQARNPLADGLTAGNMAGRFTALRGVLGELTYGELLGRHGYREVVDIANVDKGREVYRLLLAAFRTHFAEVKRAVGQAEYDQILRDMRFNPRARLTPEQAIRVFNLELSPKLRQTVKTHFSLNGELSHGSSATEVHERV